MKLNPLSCAIADEIWNTRQFDWRVYRKIGQCVHGYRFDLEYIIFSNEAFRPILRLHIRNIVGLYLCILTKAPTMTNLELNSNGAVAWQKYYSSSYPLYRWICPLYPPDLDWELLAVGRAKNFSPGDWGAWILKRRFKDELCSWS